MFRDGKYLEMYLENCRRYLENSGAVGHGSMFRDLWITLVLFGVSSS